MTNSDFSAALAPNLRSQAYQNKTTRCVRKHGLERRERTMRRILYTLASGFLLRKVMGMFGRRSAYPRRF